MIQLRYVLAGLILVALLGGVALIWSQSPIIAQPTLTPNDHTVVAQGRVLYDANCASCHGRKLEGQPNWRQRDADGYLPAPPHDATGHTWHHADKLLFELTKLGLGAFLGDENFKTRMPAYKGILSDQEIIAVLSYVKSQWSTEIQVRHDKINEAAKPR
jgi:mono/diheme cytochrome c family protein